MLTFTWSGPKSWNNSLTFNRHIVVVHFPSWLLNIVCTYSWSLIVGMMVSKNVKKSWYFDFQVHYRALINLHYQDFSVKYKVLIVKLPRLPWFLEKKFDYHDFTWKIMIIKANKCSIVNLKFTIPQFFDIFGHHHPDNWGPTVLCT